MKVQNYGHRADINKTRIFVYFQTLSLCVFRHWKGMVISMKAKNLNNSSKKTKRLIKKIFAEMLSEKKNLASISVSELCQRAELSRGTFYSHYDDIYGVAEEYENELIDAFFDKTRLIASQSIAQFIDSVFEYIRQNDESYRLLCKSNESIFAAKKLTTIVSKKLTELCQTDCRIKKNDYIEMEIQIFVEGLFCEYMKYCREYSAVALDDLYAYTKFWAANFLSLRSA